MKKQIVLMALAALVSTTAANAQGGFQRRTPEERAKSVHEKMDSAFKLSAAKLVQVDSLFTNFYKTSDATREEMRTAGSDMDAMRSKMQELATARDEKLKKILTDDQMKTWKDTIEPSMRPQRRGPGGQ